MELYAGLDLHSRNTYIGIMDDTLNRVFKKRVPNDLDQILTTLTPFKDRLKGFVVESTFNWYWLVDGLMDAGYTVKLANPAAMKQYEGLKYSDDDTDARWLAKLLRPGLLPQGYIYPKKVRPVRDLLRELQESGEADQRAVLKAFDPATGEGTGFVFEHYDANVRSSGHIDAAGRGVAGNAFRI